MTPDKIMVMENMSGVLLADLGKPIAEYEADFEEVEGTTHQHGQFTMVRLTAEGKFFTAKKCHNYGFSTMKVEYDWLNMVKNPYIQNMVESYHDPE